MTVSPGQWQGGEGGWLDLLLGGADAEDFVALLTQRQNGADPQDRERAAVEYTRALQLRSMLGDSRARAAELHVLDSVTRKLAQLRSVEEVLDEIVEQSHRVLAMDLVYLALADQGSDELVLVAAAGVQSQDLQGLRLSTRTGVVGSVLSLAAPCWTSNYLGDNTINHSVESDRAASTEQIRSLLGVPMILRDDVIGVLLAGRRREHRFSSGEVGMLTSLAAHAAIAIHNAHQFARAERAESETRSMNQDLRARDARRDSAAALHDRLIDRVVDGATVHDIVEELAAGLHCTIGFVQCAPSDFGLPEDGGPVWGGPNPVDSAALVEMTAAAARLHSADRGCVVRQLEDGTYVTSVAVARSGEELGSFVLCTASTPDEDVLEQVRRSGAIVQLVIRTRRATREVEERLRSNLLADLLTRPEATEALIRQGSVRAPINTGTPHAVVALLPSPGGERRTRDLAAIIARDSAGVWTEVTDSVVVLVPERDSGTAHDRVRAALSMWRSDHALPTIGVSNPATGVADVAEAFTHARRAARLLLAMDRPGQCVAWDELSPYGLLFEAAGRGQASRFVDKTIGPLRSHDEVHGTEFLRTIEMYFACGQRHAATARALFVHSNTLYHRFDRIDSLIGTDWNSPTRTFEVQMAIRIQRLMTGTPGPDAEPTVEGLPDPAARKAPER